MPNLPAAAASLAALSEGRATSSWILSTIFQAPDPLEYCPARSVGACLQAPALLRRSCAGSEMSRTGEETGPGAGRDGRTLLPPFV